MADVVINFQANNLAAPEITKLQTEIGMLKAAFDASRKEVDASKVGLIAYNTATREGSTALHNFNEQLLQQNGYWRDKNGRLRDVNGKFAAVRKTLEQLRREFDDNTRPAFFALTAAITDTDAELEALKTTAESAETIFEDSTGLVREWNREWANSKVAVLDFKEALDGVALPDIPDVTVPDLTLPGVQSPIDAIIEDMNSVQGAADALEKEVTDAGQSFDDLRTATTAAEPSLDTLETKFDAIQTSVDGLPEGVSDFQASLELLSDNAPNLLSGLFDVLGQLDSRFDGIGRTAAAIGSGDPVGFLASIPGLQQSLQSLLAPLDESDASANQRAALAIRRKVQTAPLDESDQALLLGYLDTFIREVTIGYIRSQPEAFANATIAQQESSLAQQGFDFAYNRDVAALQAQGIQFGNFGELFREPTSADLSGIVGLFNFYLDELAARAEQAVVEPPVAAAPSAPGVVQQTEAPVVQASEAMVAVENLELAALDASAGLLNESALALSRAASDHSLAAAAHTQAANAIVAAANRLGAQGGGGGNFGLSDEAILAIGNNLVGQQADGRFVGFPREG